jgi:hypothetical protein
VKLLVDQNLSRNLVGRLRDYFPGSAHVTTLGLKTATVFQGDGFVIGTASIDDIITAEERAGLPGYEQLVMANDSSKPPARPSR